MMVLIYTPCLFPRTIATFLLGLGSGLRSAAMSSSCGTHEARRAAASGDDGAAVAATGNSSMKMEPQQTSPLRSSSRDSSSPDDTCAICLGRPENKSFTDSCFHTFCFSCLAEWSKLKAECPLCKQRFKSIIHSVRSLEDYDQYFVRQSSHPSIGSQTEWQPEPEGRRFRFPTTLTGERIQQLNLEHRLERLNQQITSVSRFMRDHERAPVQRRSFTTTSSERRDVYHLNLWVSASTTRYREASPQFYRENPACTHRLIPWLNRELVALLGNSGSGSSNRITLVMELILSLITQVDIRHPDFFRHLWPYLGTWTSHFVHEFYAFATSVHDMVNYDRNAVYMSAEEAAARGVPASRYCHQRSDEVQDQYRALPVPAPPFPTPVTAMVPTPQAESPRPGPSGMMVAPPRQAAQAAPSMIVMDSDSDSSDCILVSVAKAVRERTPVVIDLVTSDEDEECGGPAPSVQQHESRDSDERVPPHGALVKEASVSTAVASTSTLLPSEVRKPHGASRRARLDSWTSDSDDDWSSTSSDSRSSKGKKNKSRRHGQSKLRSVVGTVIYALPSRESQEQEASTSRHGHNRSQSRKRSKKHRHKRHHSSRH